MEEKQYTIDDLVEITGYSRRTIRYYIAEGLLAPPAGRGRGGLYYDSHVNRLKEIKAFQERGLSIATILSMAKEETPTIPALERDVWVRLGIVPGVELHVSRSVEEKERKKLLELMRIARTLLETGGKADE